MADKCTSFLDLLSFPFTSLVCKSLFIFPVFWTLTKRNQFKLSFLSAITISYFWTRHLCITHCFSTLSVLSHTVALSQHICCLQNFLLDCHIMPQTIFCILKTAEFQSLLYQHNQEQIIPCLWISSEKKLAAACLFFLPVFTTTLLLIVPAPQQWWFIFISMLHRWWIIRCLACFCTFLLMSSLHRTPFIASLFQYKA